MCSSLAESGPECMPCVVVSEEAVSDLSVCGGSDCQKHCIINHEGGHR